MKRSVTTLLPALLFAFVLATPASAQRGEGHDSARSGLWGGFGLGWGSVGCEECVDRSSGFSGMGMIGGTLSDVVRIGGGGSGFYRTENNVELDLTTTMFIIQVFPGAGDLYLQGGAGFATADLTVLTETFEDEGAAFQVGIGYSANLGDRGKWAIVPFANWTGTSIDFEPEFFQIGVGFFWN